MDISFDDFLDEFVQSNEQPAKSQKQSITSMSPQPPISSQYEDLSVSKDETDDSETSSVQSSNNMEEILMQSTMEVSKKLMSDPTISLKLQQYAKDLTKEIESKFFNVIKAEEENGMHKEQIEKDLLPIFYSEGNEPVSSNRKFSTIMNHLNKNNGYESENDELNEDTESCHTDNTSISNEKDTDYTFEKDLDDVLSCTSTEEPHIETASFREGSHFYNYYKHKENHSTKETIQNTYEKLAEDTIPSEKSSVKFEDITEEKKEKRQRSGVGLFMKNLLSKFKSFFGSLWNIFGVNTNKKSRKPPTNSQPSSSGTTSSRRMFNSPFGRNTKQQWFTSGVSSDVSSSIEEFLLEGALFLLSAYTFYLCLNKFSPLLGKAFIGKISNIYDKKRMFNETVGSLSKFTMMS